MTRNITIDDIRTEMDELGEALEELRRPLYAIYWEETYWDETGSSSMVIEDSQEKAWRTFGDLADLDFMTYMVSGPVKDADEAWANLPFGNVLY